MSGRTPDEGRYSKVSRRKWDDARFRQLSKAKPNAQTLWDRLLTGPELGCIPGLFAARQGGLAEALEWPVAALRKCWLEIEGQGMAQADWSAGLVWVPNSIRHNEPQSVNAILGWRLALRELPECDLKRRAIETIGEHIARMGDSWAKAFAVATGKPRAMASPMATAKPSDMGSRIQEQDSGERERSLAATGSQDLSGDRGSGVPGEAAAAPVVRGLVPVRRPAPTNQQDAEKIPIAERARLVLEDPGNGQWSSPQAWPEVVAVAEALAHAAGNRARPRLGGPSGDSGTKRVLQLLADGWPPAELVTLAAAVGRSKWWHDGGVKGLSSLTPEVLRRVQNESPSRGAPMDPEIAREIAKTKALVAGIGTGGT